MYNKFSIEAFVGKDQNTQENGLAILINFDGKELLLPIVQCQGQEAQINSIKEHIRIANSLINNQIEQQIKEESPKIIV